VGWVRCGHEPAISGLLDTATSIIELLLSSRNGRSPGYRTTLTGGCLIAAGRWVEQRQLPIFRPAAERLTSQLRQSLQKSHTQSR